MKDIVFVVPQGIFSRRRFSHVNPERMLSISTIFTRGFFNSFEVLPFGFEEEGIYHRQLTHFVAFLYLSP